MTVSRKRWILALLLGLANIAPTYQHAQARGGERCDLLEVTVRGTRGDDVLRAPKPMT
jgi:hypothetical protein